jgi:hypothetical protein
VSRVSEFWLIETLHDGGRRVAGADDREWLLLSTPLS